jgi:hypothetical protein
MKIAVILSALILQCGISFSQDSLSNERSTYLQLTNSKTAKQFRVDEGSRVYFYLKGGIGLRGNLAFGENGPEVVKKNGKKRIEVDLDEVIGIKYQTKTAKNVGAVMVISGPALITTSVIVLFAVGDWDGIAYSVLIGVPGWAMTSLGTPIILSKKPNKKVKDGWTYKVVST